MQMVQGTYSWFWDYSDYNYYNTYNTPNVWLVPNTFDTDGKPIEELDKLILLSQVY